MAKATYRPARAVSGTDDSGETRRTSVLAFSESTPMLGTVCGSLSSPLWGTALVPLMLSCARRHTGRRTLHWMTASVLHKNVRVLLIGQPPPSQSAFLFTRASPVSRARMEELRPHPSRSYRAPRNASLVGEKGRGRDEIYQALIEPSDVSDNFCCISLT